MIILGLDGGFASMGYCLADCTPKGLEVLKMGLLTTQKTKGIMSASEDNVRRARQLTRKLDDLILNLADNIYKFPSCICSEAMSYPRSASTSCKLGIAWGVVTALAETRGLPIAQCSPMDLKMACAGKKTASKGEVRAALSMHYPSSMEAFEKAGVSASQAEHPWDALGAIVACLDTDIVRALVKR